MLAVIWKVEDTLDRMGFGYAVEKKIVEYGFKSLTSGRLSIHIQPSSLLVWTILSTGMSIYRNITAFLTSQTIA
jgi:hypothetical protein